MSNTERNTLTITGKAAGAIPSTYDRVMVKITTAPFGVSLCGAGDEADAICRYADKAIGDPVSLDFDGLPMLVQAGGVIPTLSEVTSDADGRAVVAGVGDVVSYLSLNAANTAAGDLVPVRKPPQGRYTKT